MPKIVRFNGNLVPFASASIGTERTLFGGVTQANDITSQFTAEFLRGWGIVGPSDQPTLQDFNAVSYTHGQILAYLHQMGIAEWNSAQEYYVGSQATVNGVIYNSLTNSNIGNNPTASPTNWRAQTTGRLLGVQVFTGSGTYTPTPGTISIVVEGVGGGGAGAGAPATGAGTVSCGSGGTAGSYGKARFTSGFSGLSVTVGAAGVPSAGNNGGSGGSSSFGGLLSIPGGIGGAKAGPAAPAFIASANNGTAPTGANIIGTGGAPGQPGQAISTTAVFSGNGASSHFGGGATASGSGGVGVAANAFGAGGGGTAQTPSSAALSGGTGGMGIVIIWEYS